MPQGGNSRADALTRCLVVTCDRDAVDSIDFLGYFAFEAAKLRHFQALDNNGVYLRVVGGVLVVELDPEQVRRERKG